VNLRRLAFPHYHVAETNPLLPNAVVPAAGAGGADLLYFRALSTESQVHYTGAPLTIYAAGTTGAMIVGELRVHPLVIARACTLKRLAVEVSGAGAVGSVYRLGMYAAATSGDKWYPGALVADGGEIDGTAAPGLKLSAALAVALTPGLYFLGMNVGVASPTFRVFSVATQPAMLVNFQSANANNGWKKTSAYDVLPATFPAGAGLCTNSTDAHAAILMRLDA
jgi:hypothetical protein